MLIGEIETQDISVVVQGAINLSCTGKCLAALRESFPCAEIVLSTWEGSVTAGLEYDVLLKNADPGALEPQNAAPDNVNRQIRSTLSALRRCTRKYALKIRSDCFIASPKMLNYWTAYPKRQAEYIWMEHRVIIPSLECKCVLDQGSLIPVPFHFSDWAQFGLRCDLLKIWDIPLVSQSDYPNYFLRAKERGGVKLKGCWTNEKMTPEIYIYATAAKKAFPAIKYDSLADYSSEVMDVSERLFANNFIMADPKRMDLYIMKQPYLWQIENIEAFRKYQPDCLYTERDFQELYEAFCS